MRNLLVSVVTVVALVACGPSAKELSGAKQARYKADKAVLFQAVKEATEAKYKLQSSDETTLGMQTIGKWYTPEGLVAEHQEDMRKVPDQSLQIALVVTLLPDGEYWIVKIVPQMLRYFSGRPNPDKLDPKDPSVPSWATSRVDQLHFDIYEAIKRYEVKNLGQMAPAPAAPEAPPAAPPAGSDAPPASAPPAP